MGLADFIAIAVIVLIIGAAVAYVIIKKRKGACCIGCPNSAACSAKKGNCKGKTGN